MHSAETRRLIDRYKIGRIEGRWNNLVPPIQGGHEDSNWEEKEKKTPPIDGSNHIPEEQDLAFLNAQTKEEISLTLDRYPSLDAPTQSNIIERYCLLHEQVLSEGLYGCRYTAYLWELGRCGLLFALMLFFLHIEWYCTSAVFLGWFWSHMVFSAHDAGHTAHHTRLFHRQPHRDDHRRPDRRTLIGMVEAHAQCPSPRHQLART